MYYFGFISYAVLVGGAFFIPALHSYFAEIFEKAGSIASLVTFFFMYPLTIFTAHFIRKQRNLNSLEFLKSQFAISTNTCVSLGLIGTFLGLTQMIEHIATAMNSDAGEMTERIQVMISGISASLGSMSFAFVTSILGVGAAVFLSLLGNFFYTYYDEPEENRKEEMEEQAQQIQNLEAKEKELAELEKKDRVELDTKMLLLTERFLKLEKVAVPAIEHALDHSALIAEIQQLNKTLSVPLAVEMNNQSQDNSELQEALVNQLTKLEGSTLKYNDEIVKSNSLLESAISKGFDGQRISQNESAALISDKLNETNAILDKSFDNQVLLMTENATQISDKFDKTNSVLENAFASQLESGNKNAVQISDKVHKTTTLIEAQLNNSEQLNKAIDTVSETLTQTRNERAKESERVIASIETTNESLNAFIERTSNDLQGLKKNSEDKDAMKKKLMKLFEDM